MRAASFFAGIGGFDLGFRQAGIDTLDQVEISVACRAVLAEHFPEADRSIEDICDARRQAERYTNIDVVTGGFPCQDISLAGKRAGLAGKRSGLWHEFAGLIERARPRYVVIENVPGLLSSNGGRDFATVLYGLAKFGYRVAYRILDSQFFGVAQRRRRVYIVGSLRDGRSAEILFERESMPGDTEPVRKAGQVSPTLFASGAGTERSASAGSEADFVIPADRQALALQSHNSRLNHDQENIVPGPISFDWQASSDGDQSWKGKGRSTIVDKPGRTRSLNASRKLAVFEPRFARNGRGAPEEIVPPLKAESGQTGKGDSAPVVIAFTERGRNGAQEIEAQADLAYALTSPHPNSGTKKGQIAADFGARRLTPIECERLQGFPDNWTGIIAAKAQKMTKADLAYYRQHLERARGRAMADDEVRHLVADSIRYRQLGNAVTVNVAAWLGRRIRLADGG